MDRHLTRGCMMPVPTHANLYQYLVNKHSQLPEILRQSEACTGDSAANPCCHFTAVCILMSSARPDSAIPSLCSQASAPVHTVIIWGALGGDTFKSLLSYFPSPPNARISRRSWRESVFVSSVLSCRSLDNTFYPPSLEARSLARLGRHKKPLTFTFKLTL